MDQESKVKSRVLQIGLAIGWFVIIDTLFRTLEAVEWAIASAGPFSSLVANLSGSSDTVETFAVVITLFAVLLLLLMAIFLIRISIDTIRLTKLIVFAYLLPRGQNYDQGPISQEENENILIHKLFGDEHGSDQSALFWRLLRGILIVWALLLMFHFIASLAQFRY